MFRAILQHTSIYLESACERFFRTGDERCYRAALTKKLNKENTTVFSLHGDGELEEGQIWEAALFAPHHKVDNLISTIDWNGQQIDGTTAQVGGLGNIREKFEAFGWTTLEMNGNDINEVVTTLTKAKNELTGKGKPIAIMMHTIMGKGVDFMENDHNWHGTAPNDEQLQKALAPCRTADSTPPGTPRGSPRRRRHSDRATG